MTRFEQELEKYVKRIHPYFENVGRFEMRKGAHFARDFYEPLLREAMEALELTDKEYLHSGENGDCLTCEYDGYINGQHHENCTSQRVHDTLASIREKLK